ncbi:conserved Plasmodium protein, unknown function [Plasmodium gallinaceum]|uniref:Uncharacterized protein n=1 Tax=Plasmodium gallinaceum TaxID=5849 RepID=A0A1J1GXA6_PLAGA|nr:conserved Plasmodium protein, unknown function [Plasmodium gallinaceum]CRG97084.1 conserved Plasmodium protein, unknown function [Plasmodium gallinaceum]
MSELLSIKNLFICSHEKSVDELKSAIEGLIGKNKIENSGDNKNEKKYDMIKDYLDANKNNVLHFAVYGNNFNNVKFIIENTNLINSFNIDEQNSLIISILNKNTEISKYLIDNNIDYNKTDKYKSNALLYSLITQNYEIFNILIEKKNIDININSYEKGNLISICVFEKNIKILKKLLNKNISPSFEKNIFPHPLIFIIYSNDNDLLYLYLTYSLYYYTKNEELYKLNEINFDDKTNKIIIDLENKHIIDSILNDKKYDLTIFKKLLNLKDENGSSLLDICTNNNNNTGRNVLLYYSGSE